MTHTPFRLTIGNKFTAREKLCFKWYPTPGCISHKHPRSKYVFERHVALKSNKANLIYWRLHPKEWEQVRSGYSRKHL